MPNLHAMPPSQTSQPKEIHLRDYLNALYRRRKPAVTVFLAVMIAVLAWNMLSRPVFQVSSTLQVKNDKIKGGDFLGDLGLRRENPIATEIEILKSRTDCEEVVRRLHLNWSIGQTTAGLRPKLLEFESTDLDPTYFVTLTGDGGFEVADREHKVLGQGRVGVRLKTGGVTLLFDQLQGKVGDSFRLTLHPFIRTVDALRNAIKASEVGKGTNIIQITLQDTNPRRARDIVNTLTAVHLERSVNAKSEEARRSVVFIESQLDEVRGLLGQAEKRLEDYKASHGVVSLDAEAQALIDRISGAEKAKNAALLQQRQAEFSIAALTDALARKAVYAPGALLDDPVIAGLADNLANLEVQRQGLLVDYAEANPKVRALDESIVAIQNKLLASYQSLHAALGSQVKDLEHQLASFEVQLKKLPAAEQNLARLTRLAKVNGDIYTFLLQKHEEARISQASTISSINVIDPAIAPDLPIKPQKRKNVLLGLIVGVLLGCGFAFFLEYLDDTIKDSETAERLLGLPVLATIPFIGRAGLKPGTARTESQRVLITAQEPKSPPAEAFRALRTAIHFSSKERKQVMMVTSTFPGEGKTTTSANLAETIAQTGAKVLLIGCDLRKPTLHTIFETPKTPGLTELLIGDANLDQVVLTTHIPNLDFISAGTTPPNPAELLGSSRMVETIDSVRARYDTIILDAPPMLAVTDASLLTAVSDLVVLVLEASGVKVKAAQRMADLLRSARAPIAGIAFNDKSGKGADYYTYYGKHRGQYGYGYYSGSEDDEIPKKWGLFRRIFRK